MSNSGPSAADFGSDIGALGLRAAASIVDQMLSLSRQLTEVRFPLVPLDPEALAQTDASGNGDGNGHAPPPPGDRRQQMRQLRADAERLIELYADWTRALLDGAARLADVDRAPVELLVAKGSPGEPASATAWLHVLDGPPAPAARLHATDLASHDGTVVPGRLIAFDPPAATTSDRATSLEVTLTIAVPDGATPGTYHGHVLADGLPEVCLPLRLEVS
jgi:hypothetical protein